MHSSDCTIKGVGSSNEQRNLASLFITKNAVQAKLLVQIVTGVMRTNMETTEKTECMTDNMTCKTK